MKASTYIRQGIRETRGAWQRLIFFVACLAIGVAAIVIVASLSRSLDQGVRGQARELLGADIGIRARTGFPEEVRATLGEIPDTRVTYIREQPTVVATASGKSEFCELKILDGSYPYYGSLELTPAESLDDVLTVDTVGVAAELAVELGVALGDVLRIGGKDFRIVAVAHAAPDRITGFMYLGPRVYLTAEAFARTTLNSPAGARFRALIKLDGAVTPAVLEGMKEDLVKSLPLTAYQRIETYVEGRPQLQRGLARLDQFLGLVALLSLLLGGVGVAQAVRAWIETRMDSIAILKCIGMRPAEVLRLYLGQTILLGVLGSVLGIVIALAFLYIVPPLVKEHVPAEMIDPFQPVAMLRGLLLGVAVSVLFCLPPLLVILRVAPARVLRRNADPLPEARWITYATTLAIVLGIALLSAVQASNMRMAVQFTGGVLATGAVLALAAMLLIRITAKIPRDFGTVSLRHGLAAINRPGANTVGSIVALGFGLLVLFTSAIVQSHLSHQLESEIPSSTPSAVMMDVRLEQLQDVREMFEEAGGTEFAPAPLAIGRIVGMDDRSTEEIVEDEEVAGSLKRQLRRQQWITFAEDIPPDNTIVSGSLWSDPERDEISLEEDIADRLEAEVGTVLRFAIGGDTREFVVTSIRRIEWEELGMNFEYIAEPGSLDGVRHTFLATVSLPDGTEREIQDRLVAAYPNITFVRVGEVLERIALQLTRIGWGVRMLGLFIVAAGLAVLAGAIGIESRQRAKEVALLKTLGMTRRGVAAVFATEYALLGFVSGLIGITGGGITAYFAITRGMEIDFVFYPPAYALTLFAGVALAVTAGVAASLRALQERPIEVLRHE